MSNQVVPNNQINTAELNIYPKSNENNNQFSNKISLLTGGEKPNIEVKKCKIKDIHLEQLIKQDYLKEKKVKNKNKENQLNSLEVEDIKYFDDDDSQLKKQARHLILEQQYSGSSSYRAMSNSKSIASADIEIIKKSLSTHFLFTQLSEKMINTIAKELLLFQIERNYILFSEGEKGYFFFIVKSGRLQLEIANCEGKKILTQGDTFGEMALIQRTRRSGTVKCIEKAEIYFLDGKIFRDTIYKINKDDFLQKNHSVNLIPIFQFIKSVEINNIASKLIKSVYESGSVIIKQNEIGESLYLIKEGIVKCSDRDGEEVRQLGQNDFFGENSILFEINRSLTVTAITKVKLYQISKSDLIKCLGERYKDILLLSTVKNSLLNKTKYLKYLLVYDFFEKLVTKIELKYYKENEIIINHQNYNNDNNKLVIIVVISGTVSYVNQIYKRGDIFGEEFLPKGKKRISLTSNVIASSESFVYLIKWTDIVNSIDIPNIKQHKILQFFEVISHIKKIQLFKHFSDYQIIGISKKLTKKTYKPTEQIITENSKSSYVFFLYKGKIQIYKKNKFIREYQDYACFGEISILKHINHTASVQAVTKASVFLLSREDFFNIIDNNMFIYLNKKFSLLDHFNIELDKLLFVKQLGKGKFGSVSLVYSENKKNPNLYAIKSVSKYQAEKNKILTKYFKNEREILLKIDHPFIIKLIKTFQNEQNVFYLMEYINGCELSRYLSLRNKENLQNKKETQFYLSILLVIVSYLNSKNMIHRDIKPDNIMINESGYLTLIDFNTCREIKDLTSTLAGTPHYIAPEILLGKGYGMSVDYWSIGVIGYRIYFGILPFGRDMNDPIEIYKDIIKGKVDFPETGEISELLGSLLRKDVWERLCDIDLLKKFRFFQDFDWNQLIDMKIKPPFIPQNIEKTEHIISKIQTKIRYIDYVKKTEEYNMSNNNSNIDEDEEEEEDLMESYEANWAKDF